jgi:hypothetical protein
MLQLELNGIRRATNPLNALMIAVLALVLAMMLGACASEPPPEPEPVEPEPVSEPQPKPQPPRPVYTIELDFPNGPVSFTSHCDYSDYLGKLRSAHSSDRNVHAVFEHIENQSFECEGRISALRDYLRNLDALD